MKRFVLKSAIFTSLIIATLCFGFYKYPLCRYHYMYAYLAKKQLLNDTPSPKIVFIGGSNIAFGLRCDSIHKALHANVINTGLHINIGLRYMLEDIEPYLRPGDIAVIIPEYQHFTDTMDGDGRELTEILSMSDYTKFLGLNLHQWATFLSNVPNHIYTSYKTRKSKYHDEIYSYDTFNSYGDHITHYDKPHKPELVWPGFGAEVKQNWCKYVADKITTWRKKGIRTILLPPATIRTNYDKNKNTIIDIYTHMSTLGTPFAVEATRHVVPDTLCFDTPYHMTGQGATCFTNQIITELQEII